MASSFSSPRGQKNAAHHQLDDSVETGGTFDMAVFMQPSQFSKVNLYDVCMRLPRTHNLTVAKPPSWLCEAAATAAAPIASAADAGLQPAGSSSEQDNVTALPRYFHSLAGQRLETRKQRAFACTGAYNTADIFRSQTHEVNSCMSYSDAFARNESYALPVPWEPFVYQEFKEARLDFVLNSESVSIHDFVLKQVSEQDTFRTDTRVVLSSSEGTSATSSAVPSLFKPVELTLTKDQILACTDTSEKRQFNHRGYHIVPVHIEIVDVENSMPITWNVELSSSKAVRGSGGGSTQWKRWRSCAGCSSADGPVVNSYLLGPYAKQVVRDTRTLYTAPEALNTPDFSRWITADFNHLTTAFRQLKPMQCEGMQCWVIKCPQPTDRPENITDVIFWFVACHFDELTALTASYGAAYGKKTDIFNKLTENQAGEPCVWVVRRVVEDMLKMRATEYDKDEMLMNIDQVRLTITPMLRTQGWQDLFKLSKNELATQDPYARLRVSVRLVYHEYVDREAITQ